MAPPTARWFDWGPILAQKVMKYIKNNTSKNIDGVEFDYNDTHYKMDIPVGEIVPVLDKDMIKAIEDAVNKIVVECDEEGNEE